MNRPDLAAELESEMARQDTKYGSFSPDAPGIRLAIAALEDETAETLAAWRDGRRPHGQDRPDWTETRAEALQVSAVALRLVISLSPEMASEGEAP